MSNILKKSQENLIAAQDLIDKRRFTSSVHCSYYSVFQLMKYILHHKFSYDYNDQNCNSGQDSHDAILTKIMQSCTRETFRRDFRDYFNHVKRERKRADYEISMFSDIESIKVRDNAVSLISKLKSEFQIK